MAAIQFENVIPAPLFNVSSSVVMTEGPSTGNFPTPPPINPSIAIQTDQSTVFTFNWSISGMLVGWLNGHWKFDVFYELMGPSEASFPVPSTIVNNIASGTTTITVAPNTVAEGVYRIVVRMMLLKTNNTNPSPICGFVDLGLREYYKG